MYEAIGITFNTFELRSSFHDINITFTKQSCCLHKNKLSEWTPYKDDKERVRRGYRKYQLSLWSETMLNCL